MDSVEWLLIPLDMLTNKSGNLSKSLFFNKYIYIFFYWLDNNIQYIIWIKII